MVNTFYEQAEAIIVAEAGSKPHFVGDQVMSWFADPARALQAGRRLSCETNAALAGLGLGAGVGIHWGEVVEGILGSASTRSYDIIGDTVNTASRLVSEAQGGEVLLTDEMRKAAGVPDAAVGTPRVVAVKGKERAVRMWPLAP